MVKQLPNRVRLDKRGRFAITYFTLQAQESSKMMLSREEKRREFI